MLLMLALFVFALASVVLLALVGARSTVDLPLVNGGGTVSVEANGATTNDMTAAELRAAGVADGTRVTPLAGGPHDIAMSKTLVDAVLASASASDSVFRDMMPAATEVFNAAGPTAITGLSLTGLVGNFMFEIKGTAESTDLTALASVQLGKNGAGVGLVLGPYTFGAINQPEMGLDAIGPQTFASVAGDVWTVRVGVSPGGVGGDDITVHDVEIIATRVF